ncbi:P-type conjugative transfer protein TrbL [Bradyrhizobium stylosanthis]|uniref:P-type conjugative transfer protein TrbL n=1 Tax=Bradyrhizobium stylosanthis TaxID=1803665 RepID=A0A560D4J3_9BRAD|nr:P-type conjugative transfer protein TrbL [Bradyrhizobium stylosanthis]
MFVGVFAYLIGNWNSLARIVFESFAGLGLKASGAGLSSVDFFRPGKIAQVGLDAGRPILESISGLMGYVSFFENFVQITVLLFAWIVVLLAFFILAIQLFVTLIAAAGESTPTARMSACLGVFKVISFARFDQNITPQAS